MSDSAARETPIADHGMIGDLRTVALVSVDGTIDWFCPERFDAPSIFGAILDAERGGAWELKPVHDGTPRSTQFYFPDSNVLVTRLMNDDGVVELQDFMPVADGQRIVRRVRCVRGRMTLRSRLAPRFDYGRVAPERIEARGDGVTLIGDGPELTLRAGVALEIDADAVTAEFEIVGGDTVTFVLAIGDAADGDGHEPAAAEVLFNDTVAYWRSWLHSSTYTGRWREMVHRSALTLKLLTYKPTGAIIAAPTTSLPEMIGGSRNWDYRYVWMRDAAFSVYALICLGFTDEAGAFSDWTKERIGAHDGSDADLGPLQVMYRVDGTSDVTERELDHLRGHAGSSPVRIGNGAAGQLQLDIYGELLDSIYLYDKYGQAISHDTWMAVTEIVDWLCENWDQADSGIWEERDEPRNHTFSRLMSWVAIERAIRVARSRGLPGDVVRWSERRDEIYMQIIDQGFDEDLGAFVGTLGQHGVLDASLLTMPMVKFMSPTDPRFVSTLEAIEASLVADTLVYRYDPDEAPDGLDGAEGTFSICSFWYIEALTRVGRLEDARLALEKMFTYANHLGLYAEEVSAAGEQTGNFPQAFTHLALISAAYNLDRALNAHPGL